MRSEQAPPDQVRASLSTWAERAGPHLVVLFGSSASAGPKPFAGDLDLAVWFASLPAPRRRLEIIGELQDLVPLGRVDVVFLRPETDPVLRFEVFRTGEPLHEAREGLFVDEAVRALSLYEDAIPFRRALEKTFVPGRDPS